MSITLTPQDGYTLPDSVTVTMILAATPDARLVPLFAGNDGMLTLLPEESGEWRSDAQLPTVHDGFFYALLEKQA